MKISITIANKIAKADNPPTIVCGNSDYTIAFNFDSEWNEYALKTARFVYTVCGRLKRYIDVVFSGNECSVPKLHNIDAVEVGVYAGDLHTTTPAYIPCEKSILCDGGVPDAPSEDVYNQIMELIAESGAGGGKQEVFLAEFSKTQYADIHAAVESGMVVVVRDVEQGNVAYYALCEQTESGYAFGCIYGETPNFIVTVAIDVADVWSKKYTHLATEEYVDEKVATLELVKIVTELPEVGEENKTYFVTKTDGEGNDLYDEYMWINGAWEYIGTKTIEVDLTDYVKNTDYASVNGAGVVKMANHNSYGLYMANNGDTIAIAQANEGDIANKASIFKPITPNKLDYAVKRGLCDSKLAGTGYAWTEEEKTAARELLGVPIGNGAGKNSAQQALDAASWAPDSSQTEVLTNAAVKKDGGAILTGAFGDFSTAMGGKSQATGKRAFAEGTSTIALGNYSHSEGNKTFAKAVNSHAEGLLTNALGEVSHSEGTSTIASGDASHAEGAFTVASGYASHAENDQNEASGNASHAGGVYSKAKHNMSFVHGTYLETGRQNQAVFGEYNAVDGNALFVVGNGTSTTDRKNAFQVNADGTVYANGKQIGGVFFAEYGVTKYAEIQAAIEKGKAVFVSYFNMGQTYYLTLSRHAVNSEPTGYSFSCVYPLAGIGHMMLGYANVNEADEWSEAWKTIALS